MTCVVDVIQKQDHSESHNDCGHCWSRLDSICDALLVLCLSNCTLKPAIPLRNSRKETSISVSIGKHLAVFVFLTFATALTMRIQAPEMGNDVAIGIHVQV